MVCKFPLVSVDVTEPVRLPEVSDALASAGSTAPTTRSIEMSETAAAAALRICFFLRD